MIIWLFVWSVIDWRLSNDELDSHFGFIHLINLYYTKIRDCSIGRCQHHYSYCTGVRGYFSAYVLFMVDLLNIDAIQKNKITCVILVSCFLLPLQHQGAMTILLCAVSCFKVLIRGLILRYLSSQWAFFHDSKRWLFRTWPSTDCL